MIAQYRARAEFQVEPDPVQPVPETVPETATTPEPSHEQAGRDSAMPHSPATA